LMQHEHVGLAAACKQDSLHRASLAEW